VAGWNDTRVKHFFENHNGNLRRHAHQELQQQSQVKETEDRQQVDFQQPDGLFAPALPSASDLARAGDVPSQGENDDIWPRLFWYHGNIEALLRQSASQSGSPTPK
jgi:hypothetical protein